MQNTREQFPANWLTEGAGGTSEPSAPRKERPSMSNESGLVPATNIQQRQILPGGTAMIVPTFIPPARDASPIREAQGDRGAVADARSPPPRPSPDRIRSDYSPARVEIMAQLADLRQEMSLVRQDHGRQLQARERSLSRQARERERLVAERDAALDALRKAQAQPQRFDVSDKPPMPTLPVVQQTADPQASLEMLTAAIQAGFNGILNHQTGGPKSLGKMTAKAPALDKSMSCDSALGTRLNVLAEYIRHFRRFLRATPGLGEELGKHLEEEAKKLAALWLHSSGNKLAQAAILVTEMAFDPSQYADSVWDCASQAEPLLLENVPDWMTRDYESFIVRAERSGELLTPYHRMATVLFIALKELGAQDKRELSSLTTKAEQPWIALQNHPGSEWAWRLEGWLTQSEDLDDFAPAGYSVHWAKTSVGLMSLHDRLDEHFSSSERHGLHKAADECGIAELNPPREHLRAFTLKLAHVLRTSKSIRAFKPKSSAVPRQKPAHDAELVDVAPAAHAAQDGGDGGKGRGRGRGRGRGGGGGGAPPKGTKGAPKGKGAQVPLCILHQQGRCTFGNRCKYSHAQGNDAPAAGAGAAGGEP